MLLVCVAPFHQHGHHDTGDEMRRPANSTSVRWVTGRWTRAWHLVGLLCSYLSNCRATKMDGLRQFVVILNDERIHYLDKCLLRSDDCVAFC